MRTLVRYGIVTVLGGLFLGFYLPLAVPVHLFVLGSFIFGVSAFFVPSRQLLVLFLGIAVLLGALSRGAVAQAEFTERLHHIRTVVGKVNVIGTAASDGMLHGSGVQFTLLSKSVAGERLLIKAPFGTKVAAGDNVSGSGAFTAVKTNGSFEYDAYLAHQGISGVVRMRQVRVNKPNGFSVPFIFSQARAAIVRAIGGSVPSPESELVNGMVIGAQGVSDPELLQAMNTTGTRHIVAVSGFNIALVGAFMLRILFLMGSSRRLATILASIIIAAYIMITGFSPSAVRAGIMGIVALVALQAGTGIASLQSLGVAATAMIFQNSNLFQDVSFQLSFGAVLGIILLEPILSTYVPRRLPNILREVIVLSLAVQLMVAPIGLFHFGNIALTSVIFNTIIVPFVPLVTIGGLVGAAVNFVSPLIAHVIFIPVWLFAHGMIGIILFGSRLPGNIALAPGSWAAVGIAYAFLAVVVVRWRKRQLKLRTARHAYA